MYNKKIQVAIAPHSGAGLNNEMFDPNFTKKSRWKGNTHWMETNVVWKEVSREKGIELNTYDLVDPEKVDVFIHMDLPKERAELDMFKSDGSSEKHILLLKESPLWPYWFYKRNHDFFDLVLTYNPQLVDNKKYFICPLPKSSPPENLSRRNWEGRKKIVMLNSNIYRGIKAVRTPLHYFKTLNTYKSKGWVYNFSQVFHDDPRFLYNERRKVATLAQKFFPGILDVYGRGWDGRKGGWYYRMFPDRGVKNQGVFEGEKLELFENYRYVLTFENYRGDVGYISEKMFDAMYAGAVPVYLGDEKITDHVDKRCFVDARDFKSYRDLLSFISISNENTWLEHRQHIDKYLKSEEIKYFLPQKNAERICDAIQLLIKK